MNNAGISLDTGTRVTETDVEVFRRTYETNVFGVVAVTNAFLPALRRSGSSLLPLRRRSGSRMGVCLANPPVGFGPRESPADRRAGQ